MTFEPRQPHERRLKHRHVQEVGRRLIADLVASACDAVGGLAAGLTLLSCQISVLTYPLALASLRRIGASLRPRGSLCLHLYIARASATATARAFACGHARTFAAADARAW